MYNNSDKLPWFTYTRIPFYLILLVFSILPVGARRLPLVHWTCILTDVVLFNENKSHSIASIVSAPYQVRYVSTGASHTTRATGTETISD